MTVLHNILLFDRMVKMDKLTQLRAYRELDQNLLITTRS